MPETAEAHLFSLTTNRNCVIEFTNVSSVYCLYMPKVYMDSGFPHSPPTPTLQTNKSEVCSFTKDDNTACGAVGVMTYELFNMHKRKCTELMAIMFSVPFDQNVYDNWMGMGIFERSTACDKKLFDLMYDNEDCSKFVRHKANGSGVKFRGKNVDIRGCMSDEGRAIIKLEMYDKMGK